MTLLEEMRPHYDDGFTSSERSVIENLYNKICGKPIRKGGCSDCFRDAYIEIVTTLKRLGTMPTTPNYVLKAGAMLHEFGSSNFYTLNNCPDEVAEKWLAEHPNDIMLFERTPSDWEERVKKNAALGHNSSKNDAIGSKEVTTAIEEKAEEAGKTEEVTTEAEPSSEEEKPTARRGRPSSK